MSCSAACASPTTTACSPTAMATSSCMPLCDAILGALALGDIGRHFPPSDPRWKGADSPLPAPLRRAGACARLAGGQLRRHRGLRTAEGGAACAGDARGHRRRPRDRGRRGERQGHHDRALGFTGRGEGIAAQAACLLVRAMRDAIRATARRSSPRASARRRRLSSRNCRRSRRAGRRAPAADHRKRGMNSMPSPRAARPSGRGGGIGDRRCGPATGVGHPPALHRVAAEEGRAGHRGLAIRRPARARPCLARAQAAARRAGRQPLRAGAARGRRRARRDRRPPGRDAARGVPNHFPGEQRFGRGGGNVQQAVAMFCRPPGDASARCCCPRRGRSCSTGCSTRGWRRAAGMPRWRARCGCSTAAAACSARTAYRCLCGAARGLDIHPTGPLWAPASCAASGRAREVGAGGAAGRHRHPPAQRLERAGWRRNGARCGCGRRGWPGTGAARTRWNCASACRPRLLRDHGPARTGDVVDAATAQRFQQHQHRAGPAPAAGGEWKASTSALAQHTVDQVLEHRQAFFELRPLPHDPHAADAMRAAVAQEFAQQRSAVRAGRPCRSSSSCAAYSPRASGSSAPGGGN